MKLPLSWLEKYITAPGTPEAIAERFTLTGSEVEKINTPDKSSSEVVVAQILEILKHPDADRLQLVKVKYGAQKTTDVVCGAPNIAVGQKVPLALPGTTLPNGLRLAITKIRGIESRGMLCAEDELGLGDDHAGIMVLDSRTPLGTPLPKALGFSQAVFDIDVTPNRADCFSIEGLAREYAAVTGKKLKRQKIAKLPAPKKKIISAHIVSKKFCKSYISCRISDIIIGPSPIWMQTILREAGVRPINNVVDVTNYVMLATGEPMHAFDAAKISTKGKIDISVRMAKKGEKILALDDKTYELDSSIQIISSNNVPIALAGIIGGKDSSVTEATKEIVFEVANFDGPITRKAAQKLGIRTEGSSRWEKGVPIELGQYATAYAIQVLKEITGGKVEELVIEPAAKELKPKQIIVSYERINKITGEAISKAKIKQVLTALEFSVKDTTAGKARVTVPYFRLDVAFEEDIIEEIVRLYGVNNLTPAVMHAQVIAPQVDETRLLATKIKQVMVAHGFYELYLYSFYGDKERKADCLSMFCDGRFDHLEVQKPLSPDQKYIRKSLLPGVIKSLAKNIGTAGGEEVKLFELGKVFIPQGTALPLEQTMLAGAMSFKKANTEKQLLYVKGAVESILHSASHTMKYTVQGLHDRGVVFEVQGKPIAMVYVLSAQELAQYKIKKPAVLFELSASLLEEYAGVPKKFAAYSQFPSISRDLSIEVEREVLWADIQRVLKGKTLEMTSFLSQYPLDDKKSIAFRMVFRSMQETLRSEDVDKEIDTIIRLLKEKVHATIRGK